MEHYFIYFSLIISIIFVFFLLLSIIYPHIFLVWIMDHYIKSNKGHKINKLLRRWKISISLGSFFEPFLCYVIRKSKYKFESVNYLIDLNFDVNIKGSIVPLHYSINLRDKELIKLLLEKGNAKLMDSDSLELLLTMDDEIINYTLDIFISINKKMKDNLINQILNLKYNVFNNEHMFHTFFYELTKIVLTDRELPDDLFTNMNEKITFLKETKYFVHQCIKLNKFYLLMSVLNYHQEKSQLIKDLNVEEATLNIVFSDNRSYDYSFTINELKDFIESFSSGQAWDDYQSSLLKAYRDNNDNILQELISSLDEDHINILLTLSIVNKWNEYLIDKVIQRGASFNDELETLIINYLKNNIMKESITYINQITALSINYFTEESNIKEIISLTIEGKLSQAKNKISIDKKYYEEYERVNESELYIDHIDGMSDVEFQSYLNIVFKLLGYQNIKVVTNTNELKINFIMKKDGEKFGVIAKLCKDIVNDEVIEEVIMGKTYYHLDKVFVVTNSTFSKSIYDMAESNSIILVDKLQLKEILYNVDRERFIRNLMFNFPINKTILENSTVEMSYTYRLLQQTIKGLDLSNIINKGIHEFNIQDEFGKTPLMYALESKDSKIVKQLLRYDFDLNIPDLQGKTALHYLFDYRDVYPKEIWNIFISRDSDFYALDIENRCVMVLLNESLTEELFLKHPAYKIHKTSFYNLGKFKIIYNNN